jgi:hypothetical protein
MSVTNNPLDASDDAQTSLEGNKHADGALSSRDRRWRKPSSVRPAVLSYHFGLPVSDSLPKIEKLTREVQSCRIMPQSPLRMKLSWNPPKHPGSHDVFSFTGRFKAPPHHLSSIMFAAWRSWMMLPCNPRLESHFNGISGNLLHHLKRAVPAYQDHKVLPRHCSTGKFGFASSAPNWNSRE